MKIATLAYQRHENVGAHLQCYALQRTIMKYGHECDVIDYICDAADHTFGYRSFMVKGLKKYITSCIGVISRIPKRNSFRKFRKKYLQMTKKLNKKNVKSLDGVYDGYIVGSDNVWNSKLTGLDKNYFLDFISDNKKKASYAASMGLADVPEDEKEAFKKALCNFAIITLREYNAAKNISKLLDREVKDSCDPTFFLSAEEWDKLASAPKEQYKYILVYHMSPSLSFVKFAREVAKIKGLPIVYVPFPYGVCSCKMKPHIGPCQWLGYIKNAEYIITDSFHGCVFASIYERNLIIKISQLGERIKNLTHKLGIEDRIVNNVDDAVALPFQDYSGVRENIREYRKAGLENLENILKCFEKEG